MQVWVNTKVYQFVRCTRNPSGNAEFEGQSERGCGRGGGAPSRSAIQRTGMDTGLEDAPPEESTTAALPAVRPSGTRTAVWYSPANPGAAIE